MKGTELTLGGEEQVGPAWERFQAQIERMGKRRAGILAISLVPLAPKHPLVSAK